MTTETCTLYLIHPSGATTLQLDGTDGTATKLVLTITPKLISREIPGKTYSIQVHKGIKTQVKVDGYFDDFKQMEDFIEYAETWNRDAGKYSQLKFEYADNADVVRKGMLQNIRVSMGLKPGNLGADFGFTIEKGSEDT